MELILPSQRSDRERFEFLFADEPVCAGTANYHSNRYNMAYDHFSFYASDSPVNRDNDYLQDPSLWRDTLPQPYKMINDTIQELLMSVHDEIELRNLHKERESSVRKIPVVRDANLMMSFPESEMITVVSTDEEQYIVACGQMGIFVGEIAN